MASQWLREKGYTILERNFRFRGGEVDIIAVRRGVLSFIEVKNWRANGILDLEQAVNGQRQQRMRAAAARYMAGNPGGEWEEAVFSILFRRQGEWEMIKDAFEGV